MNQILPLRNGLNELLSSLICGEFELMEACQNEGAEASGES